MGEMGVHKRYCIGEGIVHGEGGANWRGCMEICKRGHINRGMCLSGPDWGGCLGVRNRNCMGWWSVQGLQHKSGAHGVSSWVWKAVTGFLPPCLTHPYSLFPSLPPSR